MSVWEDAVQWVRDYTGPPLPPVPGAPNGPAGVPGTPGIVPGPRPAPSGGGMFARPPQAEIDTAYGDFWSRLSLIGESVGVATVLVLLFLLGIWGLLGSGGAVGYVAAPRPFRAPRKSA